MKHDPIVLVLCGGDGTRLGRFAEWRHKCLLPIDDGEPVFARHVRSFPGRWRTHANVPARWEHAYAAHKRALGLKRLTLIPIPSPPRGSGATLSFLARDNPGRDVFVCYGDTRLDRAWYDAALAQSAETTWIGAEPVQSGDHTRAGGLLRVRDGVVDRVIERPRGPRDVARATHWHAGIQHYSARDAAEIARMRGRDLDVMGDVMPRIVAGGAVRIVTASGQGAHGVEDVGTVSRYAEHCMWTQFARSGVRYRLGPDAVEAARAVIEARRIFTAGNGGACAVAQHAAIDWAKAGGRDVTALGDAVSISAWANDHGYAGALARQVERVRDPEDCALVLFSASGASPNVVEAATRARECGYGAVVSVSGADSAIALHQAATQRVRLPFGAPTGVRTYGAVEDAMSVWCHAVAVAMSGLAPWKACEAEGGA